MTITKSTKIITGITLLWTLAIGCVVLLFFLRDGNITADAAQRICDQHAGRARAVISAVPGYQVSNSSTNCNGMTDELGSTDYLTGANFLLIKSGEAGQKTALTSADTTALQQLPIVQESWSIRNIIAADGQSYELCVSTGAYIDNDGKFYSQSSGSNHASFYNSKTDNGYSDRCLDPISAD